MSVIVIAVVLTALVFDFTNGFHDTANAMATSIASGALRPRVAVLLAGVLNLAGAFLSVQVALTISSGLVDEARITPEVIFGGLVGAILWNLVTWLLGLPSSSSHALFGGLIGATWVFAGSGAINFPVVAGKVLVPLALSPIVAGVIALTATSDRLPDRRARRPAHHGPGLPAGTGRVGLDGGAGARHQRRPEDHGRDHPDPDHRGSAAGPRRATAVGGHQRRAGHRRGHRHGWLADHPAPWAGGSARSRAPRASRPRPPARPSSSARRTSGSPCRPPRSPPARSSAPRPAATGPGALGRGGRMVLVWLLTLPAAAAVGALAARSPPSAPRERCWSPPCCSSPPAPSTACPGADPSPPPPSTTHSDPRPVAVPARAAA